MTLPHDSLLEAHLDGDLDRPSFERFQDWLREDPENFEAWIQAAFLDFKLRDLYAGRVSFTSPDAEDNQLFTDPSEQGLLDPELYRLLLRLQAESESAPLVDATAMFRECRTATWRGRWSIGSASIALGGLAAAILLLVTAAVVLSGSGNDARPSASTAQPPPGASSDHVTPVALPVARLTAMHEARWASPTDDALPRVGDALYAGQMLTLTQGFAEVTTARGAKVILEAPATIELTENDNAIRLHSGKLVGICETDSSKGFVVRTPQMDVTDLGTRFGVAIDETGNALAEVFDGRVSVKARNQSQPTVLTGGELMVTDPLGRQIARDRFPEDAFSSLMMREARVLLAGQARWGDNASSAPRAVADWPADDDAYVIQENRGVRLASDWPLNIAQPGVYQQFNQTRSSVSAGTMVSSYIVAYLPSRGGDARPNLGLVRGSVTFDHEVIGIISSPTQIGAINLAEDEALQITGNDTLESVGPRSPPDVADLIELSEDRRTVSFRILTTVGGCDAFRILVREPAQTQPVGAQP